MSDHLVDIGERCWAIQHPDRCKPNMLDCDVHQEFADYMSTVYDPPVALGRYVLTDDAQIGAAVVADEQDQT